MERIEIFSLKVRRPHRLSGAVGVVLALISVLNLGHPSKAQDTFLPNPSGELTFESLEEAEDGVSQSDPVLKKRLTAAQKRQVENEKVLAELNQALTVSQERERELAESVAALERDKTTLVDQLISTARDIQSLEDALTESERELLNLRDQENQLRRSLAARRGVLSEVLAALQRIGQNPPPAIVVNASDALRAVRGAILLGAVLPELRAEAQVLIDDLQALNDVMLATRSEQNTLIEQERQLSEEQVRLDLLIKENQKLRVISEQDRQKEQEKAAALVADATNLRDLIKNISVEVEGVNQQVAAAEVKATAQAAARRNALAAERQREILSLNNLSPQSDGLETNEENGDSVGISSFSARGRDGLATSSDPRQVVDYSELLSPDVEDKEGPPFHQLRGKLQFPVRGTQLTTFGGSDGLGGISDGLTIRTRAKTPVLAPSAGKIVFADDFPGFGKLLIIDPGGGYHIVLAGMDKINVRIGDRIKRGELVAQMGGDRRARLAGFAVDVATTLDNNFSSGQTQPVLYVEFRRNGSSINPAPWWAES